MKTIGIFEAKTHFTALCDEVVRTGQPTMVSKRGKPLVLVQPVPAGIGESRKDILSAWEEWEAAHPGAIGEADFPDVRQMRGESKPNPLEGSMRLEYLLDTSIYSQPLRRRPAMAALGHWREAGDGNCKVSVVSVAEVEFGLHLEGRAERQERYRALLAGRLEIIATDQAVWKEFARRKARQQILGLPVSDLDLLIATCATCHRLTVATLNSRDFARIEGCAWEDWSE